MHVKQIIKAVEALSDEHVARLASCDIADVKRIRSDFARFLSTFEATDPMEFGDWHEAWGRYCRIRLQQIVAVLQVNNQPKRHLVS